MASTPPLAPDSLGWPSAPFDPLALNSLLDRDPARAAAILAAMRPSMCAAQAQAHATCAGVPVARIVAEWRDLIARFGPLPPPAAPPDGPAWLCASVYEPAVLADLLVEQPVQAQALLDQLTPAQRITQAIAYTAWMAYHGMPVALDTVLASWDAVPQQRQAG
jgi:hypothetical protein